MTNRFEGWTPQPRDLWHTKISIASHDALLIRGFPLADLIERESFATAIWLVLRGELPTDREEELFNSVLITLLDHGFVSASVPAARYVASGNPDVVAAAAAGLLSAGKNTLSPSGSATLVAQAVAERDETGADALTIAKKLVGEYRERGQRIPGLGHPLYKVQDPRATKLGETAKRLGMAAFPVEFVNALPEAVKEATGRTIAVNIDGMLAAVMTDMGFTVNQMVAVNLISYFPGILAHSIEEIEDGVPLRTIPDPLASYGGPPLRHHEKDTAS